MLLSIVITTNDTTALVPLLSLPSPTPPTTAATPATPAATGALILGIIHPVPMVAAAPSLLVSQRWARTVVAAPVVVLRRRHRRGQFPPC